MATTSVNVTISRKGHKEDEPTTLVFDQFPVTIGRADTNDLVLEGDMISRRHAILEVRGGDVWLVDVGSESGSGVNGKHGWGSWQVAPLVTVTLGDFQLAIARSSI